MVDMEPAQQGQAVGVRWEAKQRLTTNGMFPPYKNTTAMSQSWASTTRKQNSLSSIKPLAIQIDPQKVIPHDESIDTDEDIWITKKEQLQCTKQWNPWQI